MRNRKRNSIDLGTGRKCRRAPVGSLPWASGRRTDVCARKLGARQNCACAMERKRLRLGPRWWCWYCSRDNNGEISRDNSRGPAVLFCEAAGAWLLQEVRVPAAPSRPGSGDTPPGVSRPQPSEWTGATPRPASLASGWRAASPRQFPLLFRRIFRVCASESSS